MALNTFIFDKHSVHGWFIIQGTNVGVKDYFQLFGKLKARLSSM